MEIIPREAWGARQPRGRTSLDPDDLRGMAVHYSVMAASDDHARCASGVKTIQDHHMNANGWDDIAYSWLTCQHGGVFQGRGWGVRTAANGTDPANDAYHAVCFLGLDRENRDDVQPAGRVALARTIAEGRARWPQAWEVRPHSDFRATGCPGNELRAWIRADMPLDSAGESPRPLPAELVVRSKPVAIHGCATGGYWVATEDGGVFAFGGAGFYGSLGALKLNAPIVDLVGTKSGAGYWMVGADGGMFNFGDAPFVGSLGGIVLAAPVVDLAVSPDYDGAWMLGGDGGVFGVGDAPFGGRISYRP